MARQGLRNKKAAVMNDLFEENSDLYTVLKKHSVRKQTFDKWFDNEKFLAVFNRRLAITELQREAKMAVSSLNAAAQLVELTKSQKPETARKACRDIIDSLQQKNKKNIAAPDHQQNITTVPIKTIKITPQDEDKIIEAIGKEKLRKNEKFPCN
jgi:hypothetical protein